MEHVTRRDALKQSATLAGLPATAARSKKRLRVVVAGVDAAEAYVRHCRNIGGIV